MTSDEYSQSYDKKHVYGPSATERPLRFIREEKGIYSRFLVSITTSIYFSYSSVCTSWNG